MIDVRGAHDRAQPEQNLFFGVGVDRRQRVVQDQNAGIDGDGAGERGPLFLAARQRDPALADQRVVAVRKVDRVLVETRRRGRVRDSPGADIIQLRRGPTPVAN